MESERKRTKWDPYFKTIYMLFRLNLPFLFFSLLHTHTHSLIFFIRFLLHIQWPWTFMFSNTFPIHIRLHSFCFTLLLRSSRRESKRKKGFRNFTFSPFWIEIRLSYLCAYTMCVTKIIWTRFFFVETTATIRNL